MRGPSLWLRCGRLHSTTSITLRCSPHFLSPTAHTHTQHNDEVKAAVTVIVVKYKTVAMAGYSATSSCQCDFFLSFKYTTMAHRGYSEYLYCWDGCIFVF